jgi:hypothetical protein
MNYTQKHLQRFGCLLLALFLILLLPASGSAQETATPSAETTEQPLMDATTPPTEEQVATATPEATDPVVIVPEETATPEATDPVSEETEAAEETATAAPEETSEAEVTPEVTVEAPVESTEESLQEVVLTDVGLAKFPEGIRDVALMIDERNIEVAAQFLRSLGYTVDRENRVALEIHPAEGVMPQAIEAEVNVWGGAIVVVYHAHLTAFIPLERLANLLESELVGQVVQPPTAISTGPIGDASTEGFNLGGLEDWHAAGFRGASVRVGIIDVGFSVLGYGTFADPDYSCLDDSSLPTSFEDGGFHGLAVIQTICDIAPDATVLTYEVNTEPYVGLARAVNQAMFDRIDVLLITIDIADLVPGDGTGLEDGADDPYEALETARAGGMVVIAAAGNHGRLFNPANDTNLPADGTDTRAERFTAFNVSSTTPDVEVAQIYMRATIADTIFVSWNDWFPTGLGSNTPENLEDFRIELWSYTTVGVPGSPLSLSSTHPERQNLYNPPSFSFIVPFNRPSGAGCLYTENPDLTYGPDLCNVVVRIYREKGDSPVVFHVGLAETYNTVSTPFPNSRTLLEVRTSDVEIVNFTGLAGSTLITTGGTLASPADSPNVIAVGSVCTNENLNYPLVPDSSTGPIWGANGVEPTLPSVRTQSNTKPEIVSFAYTSTTDNLFAGTGTAAASSCNGTFNGVDAADGFGSTSAAATHAAAMTAVLLSNPTYRSFFTRDAAGVLAVQNYLQRHSAEMPLGSLANGYDYTYGAGLFILGSPDFNPANVVNPTTHAELLLTDNASNTTQCDKTGDGTADGEFFYVGQGNLNSNQDGTLTNPYLSISQATVAANADASFANDCIVVMPGEYVTPILVENPNMSIYGFDNVTNLSVPATIIRVSGQFRDPANGGGTIINTDGIINYQNGGFYVNNVSGTLIQGLTFVGARVNTSSLLPVTLPRQGIFLDAATNSRDLQNEFGAVTRDGSTFDGFVTTPIIINTGVSHRIEDNLFEGNTGGSYATDLYVSPVISVLGAGTAPANAVVVRLNTIRNNKASELAASETYWSSLIYASSSYLDVVANTFLTNTASSLVYVNDAGLNTTTRVVSNLFQNNLMQTVRTTGGITTNVSGSATGFNDNAGALVQISTAGNIVSFVNNTVVVNNFTESSTTGAVLGRGTRSGLAAVGNFDFVNNLAYGNIFPSGQSVIAATGSGTCTAIDTVSAATRNNWWFNYGTTSCASAMSAANGNRVTNTAADNPLPQFMGTFLKRTNTTTDPLFYRLAVVNTTPPTTYSSGVDASRLDNRNDASGGNISSELGNSINFNAYPFEVSVSGGSRLFDVLTWFNNQQDLSPTNDLEHPEDIDIGAYEFVPLSLTDGNLGRTAAEDDLLKALDFENEDEVTGGFGTLTYEIVDYPENYGTQCGPAYSNGGSTFGTGEQSQIFFYCLPPDFYTGSAHNPDPVEIGITITDEIGIEVSGTIELTISPDSGIPVDAGINQVTSFTADDFVVIANVGQQDVLVRLRPYVDFDNFGFSERSNSDFLIGGVYAIDYPFTYSNVSVVGSDELFEDTGLPTLVGSGNARYVQFDLVDSQEGSAIIQYTVQDARGNTKVFAMTIQSISRIPLETGMYDDSSFAFDYSQHPQHWTAVSEPTAINNTLHTTTAVNGTASFGFRGTGFVLYMKGQGVLGGNFRLDLYINGATTPTPLSGWTNVSGSTSIFQSVVSDAEVVFFCTTDAIKLLTLSSAVADNYAITCNSFAYDDLLPTNGQYDVGEVLDTAEANVHLVDVVNLTNLKKIAVDAFSLINDEDETPESAHVPLPPGFHDVDELALRSAFGSSWVQAPTLISYSNSMAYILNTPLSSPSAATNISFSIQGGTGFALQTTQESLATAYTICVTNTSINLNNMTCQRFDYNKPTITPLLYGVFRPFYGLDPTVTYRVDIMPETIPTNGKLIFDGVVVFEPSDVPVNQVLGSADDSQIDRLFFGGGLDDSWSFASGVLNAFNGTMTSVPATIRGGGPFISFEVPETSDMVYWTYSSLRPSTVAMVCVDRGEGAGTDPTPTTSPLSAEVDASYGNCLVVNLATGMAQEVNHDANGTLGTAFSIKLTKTTIVLRESDFRAPWNNANSNHVFEIFSIYDAGITLDRIVAVGSSAALAEGRYEEYTGNIQYLKADATTPASIGFSESTIASTYPTLGTDFVQVLGAGALRDFGAGVMYTSLRNSVVSFKFIGTGFAPAFRLQLSAEEVEICWISGSTTALNALTNGVCQRFDNESRVIVNNAMRPILGLPFGTYTVAMRFNGDNFSPLTNRAVAPDMWFDGVEIYNEDLTTLTPLDNGILAQGNFRNHEDLNNFEYLGTGWAYDTTVRARAFSGANVDTILRGFTGATVSFETSGANAIVFTRNLLSTYAPFLVCATEVNNYLNRNCQMIDSGVRGNGNTITIYIAEDTGNYLINFTALNGSPVYFDAVTPVVISAPLTAGQYDDNNPNIIYTRNSSNRVLNGDFESTNSAYWTGGTRVTTNFYNGVAAMSVTAGGAGVGITSLPLVLQDDETYVVVAYVKLAAGSGNAALSVTGNVTMNSSCVADLTTESTRTAAYQPLRCEFTVNDLLAPITVRVLSTAAASFHVDHVQVIEGAQWTVVEDRTAFGGFRSLSLTHGAEFRFAADGTGFGLRLSSENIGGRMMVCYKGFNYTTTALQDVSFDYVNDNCISYDNESLLPVNDTLRIVDGLPALAANNAYAVLVRDMEDGDSVLRSPVTVRTNRMAIGQIRLDSIYVFDTTASVITESGLYNESATDTDGSRFLQLLPDNRWSIFTNQLGYSNKSYASVMNDLGLASRTTVGGLAMLSVAASPELRVVIDVKAGALTNSNQVLACVDFVDGILSFNHSTNLFQISDTDGTVNCKVLTGLTTSRYAILTPDDLPILATGTSHVISFQTLKAGTFPLDNYQVLMDDVLFPGYYEENLVKDVSTVAGTWTIQNLINYSGGSALVLNGPQTNQSLSFSFEGTGITIVSALTTTGGTLDIDITGPVNISNSPVSTDFATVVYGNSHSFTGLPYGTYNVTITASAPLVGEKVIIDAIEVYDELQVLGSLYDDNEMNADGVPFLSFGPNNASWTLKTGTLAATALNQTLHSTNRAGATLSFRMDNAKGIVLYYGVGTVTNPRVCFRETTGAFTETCPSPVTPLTTVAGNVQYNAPSTGDWLVSITNSTPNGTFQVDAVQVLEAGLHEGIFDVADILADPDTTHTGTATATSIDLTQGQSLTFKMTGVAFSLLVNNAVANQLDYTICVGTAAGTPCNISTESFVSQVTPVGLSAISYAGLYSDAGAEQAVFVQITNNRAATTIRISSLHILGQELPVLDNTISDTSRYENNDAHIRYLPFGSMINTVVLGNKQSGGSEHIGNRQGEIVYFEINDLSAANTNGFEYVRQMASTMSSSVELCFGRIGNGADLAETSADARSASHCQSFSNVNATPAFQVGRIIETDGYCDLGCWVTIRNQKASPMAFDFVRIFNAGAALTAGYYQDNYPALNYDDSLGGALWNPARVSQALAADGFVRQAVVESFIDNNNGAVMWFVMQGTGFSIDFVNDTFSDSVKICYAAGAQTNFTGVQDSVLPEDEGTCQIFDNEARLPKTDAQRSIIGLPFGTYTVAVQIRRDNFSPRAHLATTSPLKMSIDAVEVYNVAWTGLGLLTEGSRYETDYVGRSSDNRFFYVGESWTTLEAARARGNSGLNVDQVREYGGGIAFRTSGANSLLLYTNLGRANTIFRICATPTQANFSALSATSETICQDYSTNGVGTQMPFSFRFHEFGETPAAEYLISIVSLDDATGFIDAIELKNTETLMPGFYEETDVSLFTDTGAEEFIANGNMEVNNYWDALGSPTSAARGAIRYEGLYGWHVVSNVGSGIQSQAFALSDVGATYTMTARVKVTSGSVRVRLIDGDSGVNVSISEFRQIAPTALPNNNDWISLRAEFVLTNSYPNLLLQFFANSPNTVFDIDDVHLVKGGNWTGVYNRLYTAGSLLQSQTPGAQVMFSFTGTGFELGTEFGPATGEMEICYDTVYPFVSPSCFTYQNETLRATSGVARSVTGLPYGSYYVRIQDAEDGSTAFRLRLNASRNSRNPIGKMSLDYIRIFDANTITTTPASFFNENATDPTTGEAYLQLYPNADWSTVTARAGTGYSANSYKTVLDSLGRAATLEAGQSAILYVDVPDEGATVVLYTGPVSRTASSMFLICAGNEMNGAIRQTETLVGLRYTLNFVMSAPTMPSDCVIRNGTLGTALAVGPEDLAALATPGTNVRVSFTTLVPGQFIVDGFQVISGNTLTAGVYDTFMPDNLLDFDSTNSEEANRAALGCNPDFLWCTVKVLRSVGDTVLSTQDPNASLRFDINGTGFSVVTNLGVGARMRICYGQIPVSGTGTVSFPTKDATGNTAGSFATYNTDQDLSLGGVWCDLVTTNNVAASWNAVTPDRRLPLRAPQYGFSYYGLPMGNYAVQVLMMDTVGPLLLNALQIDAIVVFGDYNTLDVIEPGFYDNPEAPLSYEPFTSWTQTTTVFGPPRGPFGLTEATTTNAGSIVQMRVNGNALTLFQTLDIRNTADARICVVVTGVVIHCTLESATTAQDVENPDSLPPYALAFELANFSQSGRRTYFAPIMFYGLGSNTPHVVIIENRDHTKILSVDGLLVQE